jgi:hypothetical protein
MITIKNSNVVQIHLVVTTLLRRLIDLVYVYDDR